MHSRGSVPGSLCCPGHAEPRLELFTNQAPQGKLQGWNSSRLQDRRSWPSLAWGGRALSPYGIPDGAANTQLVEVGRQEKDGLHRISLLLQLGSALIAISGETALTCGGGFGSCKESRLCLRLELWSRTLLSADNGAAQKMVSEGFFEKKKVDEVRQIQSYI